METDKAESVCSICGLTYTGWGNNAEPINAGRCCDRCNWVHVIPRRIRELRVSRCAEHKPANDEK